ncbi:MAG: hypothetical protein LQ341_004107 [Variospora aurantia]|nr:MAG: hypothetical protein LQ341_004107 [Variospora aurantia]
MQLYIIVTFVGHMARVLAVDAFGPTIGTLHGNGFNISHLPIPGTNGTLLPGYHRNVSAGAAWVLPASRTDLGARAMSCECFDPDGNDLLYRPQGPWLLPQGPALQQSSHASLPQQLLPRLTASKTYNGTTTIVETVSINIVPTGFSIQFPGTITLASNLAGWSIATTYVFSFPSTIFEGEPSSSTTPSTASLPASSRPSSTTSTQRSTLCFDPDRQSPVPCTISPSDPSSSSAPAIYPAATTLHSSAQRTVSALNLYCILSSLALLYLLVHVDFFTRSSIVFLCIMNGVLQLSRTQLQDHHHNSEGDGGKEYATEVHNAVKRINEVVHYTVVVVPATMGLETVRRIKRDYWLS